MKNDMKITIEVNVESRMKNKMLNSIKSYIQEKVQDERGFFSDEFQDVVLSEDCGFDDETTFDDVGVKINTIFEHDYI